MAKSSFIFAAVVSVFAACTATPVQPAEDGRLEVESRGSIRISLSVLPSIQINTVRDINLSITNRNVDTNFSEPFCVTGNGPGRYTVSAHGSEATGQQFLLRNGDGEPLEYDVSFLGDIERNQYDPLSPGVVSPAYQLFPSKEACGDRTAFKVTFHSEDLQSAGSGLYSGYLTLVVSPV